MDKQSINRLSLLTKQLHSSGQQQQYQQLFPDFQYLGNNKLLVNESNKYIVRVILNKPKQLNSLDRDIVETWLQKLQEWQNQGSQFRIMLVKGAGDKSFCAGYDVKGSFLLLNEGVSGQEIVDKYTRRQYVLDYSLATSKLMQICFLDGAVMGGGAGVSMHSKIKIATEYSLFGMPEAKIGLFTDVGAGYFLSRLQNNLGMYLGLTGAFLKGKELVQVGLANFYVQRQNLQKLENEILSNINENSTEQDIFQIVQKFSENVQGKYQNEEIIREIFESNEFSQIYQNLQNCTQNTQFAQETLQIMNSLCPMSLRIIYQYIQLAKNLTLEQCFHVEFTIVQKIINSKDSKEGLRCFFIDKSSKPKWTHAHPLDITQEEIDYYFKELPTDLQFNL